jgi:hypothetical protein
MQENAEMFDALLPNQWRLDGVTPLCLDSSGRFSRSASLTSSDLFNPLGHSPFCLIPPIERATFTPDSPFDV